MRSLPVIAALILASACSSGSIVGDVHVGPGQDGLAIITVLWQVQDVPVDPNDAAAGTREQLVAIGQVAVGTADATGGVFPYTFHSLTKGKYLVGAYADLNDDRVPTTDEFSVDLASPYLEVDPDADEPITQDIYLAKSGPERGTIRGVLHRSIAAANLPTELLVLDGPLTSSASKLIAQRTIPAGGLDVAYTIFNVPPGDVHIIATDDFALDGRVVVYPNNPLEIVVDEARADLWMDRQAPELGSIGGTLTFNGLLQNLKVQLLLFTSDPTDTVDANGVARPPPVLVGLHNVDASGRAEVPFSLQSTPLKDVFLLAFVSTVEGANTLSTSRMYRINKKPAPIRLTPEAPQVTGLQFPLGVGRVSGNVEILNAPAGLELALVASVGPLVSPIPDGQGEIRQSDVIVVPSAGNVTLRYEMFGLEDDTFDMWVVPDVNKSGDFGDELNTSPPFVFNGTPAKVEVIGGGRVGSDFRIPLSPR